MEMVFLIAGFISGSILVFLVMSFRINRKIDQNNSNYLEKIVTAETEKKEAEKTAAVLGERILQIKSLSDQQQEELQKLRMENTLISGNLIRIETENRNLSDRLLQQRREAEETEKRLATEFENLANRILKKNSTEFSETSLKNLGEILNPLKEKIFLFEKKVEDTYEKGLKDQTDLRAELKKLYDLNSRIGEEAENLTKALKGDVKKQGNWGEVVLERILERSGLNEGEHGYMRQYNDFTDDGRRIQPDIVIRLPDNKHVIIDAKVSLTAYEKAVNSDDRNERSKHIRDHLLSMRNHIKSLGDKHYQSARTLNSPDFVLMFIPVEASFSTAIQEDQEMFSFAWDQKIVLVSPSTLLATLRTIASIWKQENQTRNALEIARQGGLLYDKFVGFVGDLEKIGTGIDSSRKSFEAALNKLKDGRGNLIRSAEKLKEMGAKSTKELPPDMIN